MEPTEKELTLKVNIDVGRSVEKLEQARQLLGDMRAIRERAEHAEEMLLALLKDWEVE